MTESKLRILKNETKTENVTIVKSIPSNYVEVKLLSNGRIKNIPKVLHFRDFTASEAVELTNCGDDDKELKVCEVLTNMNYEHFDCLNLTKNDVLGILYFLIGTFVNTTLVKSIYIDETLPIGDDVGQLNNVCNIEDVNVPINKINLRYLGLDKKDKLIEPEIKVPFTICDEYTNTKYTFKYPTMKDNIVALNFIKNKFKTRIDKLSSFTNELIKLNNVKSDADKESKLQELLQNRFDEALEYQALQKEIENTTVEIIQALQLVKVNDVEITNDNYLEYYELLPQSVWKKYIEICDNYTFGIDNEVNVYSVALNKRVKRSFQFEFVDFISLFNESKNVGRFSVDFS